MDREIMKGSIDILMLNLLVREDMYGYQIVKRLKHESNDLYNMSEGTLYPALKRLEKKEWVSSYWAETASGRRKYYQITLEGTAMLEEKRSAWKHVNDLITRTSEDGS
ncbi:PadR family transcriptional regulator [Halobacillus litoralis]|uniref:PadR family transcriptional regulator n=1 Tax=Halobacillus litoralis TaxID=45668 RepID=UPI001CD5E6EC|nr:helix-turn-helix transcriptional regulator [Halobacillus litoralis]MCA0972061.1 PadR family transcriptional regulator [Halobacillus litoralis]